jgi:hypothetical protein
MRIASCKCISVCLQLKYWDGTKKDGFGWQGIRQNFAIFKNTIDISLFYSGQFEKFWVLNFGIAAKAHFKKSAILLWRIHRIEWLIADIKKVEILLWNIIF